jgi:hypothetical protein
MRQQPDAQSRPAAPQQPPPLPLLQAAAVAAALPPAGGAGAAQPAGLTTSQLDAVQQLERRWQSDGLVSSITPAPAAAVTRDRLPGDGMAGEAGPSPPAPSSSGGFQPHAAARQPRRQRALGDLAKTLQKVGGQGGGSARSGSGGTSQAPQASGQRAHESRKTAVGRAAVANDDAASPHSSDSKLAALPSLQAGSGSRSRIRRGKRPPRQGRDDGGRTSRAHGGSGGRGGNRLVGRSWWRAGRLAGQYVASARVPAVPPRYGVRTDLASCADCRSCVDGTTQRRI